MEVKKTMDTNELRSLQEAYLEVVEGQQLDEAKEDEGLTPLQKIRKRNKAYAMPGEKAGEQTSNRRSQRASARGEKKEKGVKKDLHLTMKHVGGPYKGDNYSRYMGKTQKEQVNIYDIILSHLLDEGYAETPEAAEAIMVNMSEEWRDSIVEADSLEELYKGKHGQSDKEYADSRSQGGKMVSGDSKMSGAEYTHGRRVKAANPGMQPDVGGKTKPKSQGKMDAGSREDLMYRKANLKRKHRISKILKKEEFDNFVGKKTKK